jgi:hypothetical protein
VLAVLVSRGDVSVAFNVVAGRAAWCKVVQAVISTCIQLQYVINGIGIGFAAVCTVWFVCQNFASVGCVLGVSVCFAHALAPSA